jgi:aryl-alcohol dehydrogenase-like predicted oxidoreductase
MRLEPMQRSPLGGTGLRVAPIGLGTGGFGTRLKEPEVDRLVERYATLGGNLFDTAHVYAAWLPDGLGASETELGHVLRRTGLLREAVIATKGGHPAFGERYPRPDRFLDPELLAKDLDESLDRLDVEHVDIWFLHRDDASVPVDELLDALQPAVTRGRVGHLGASNWTTARLAEAMDWATRTGKQGFAVSQMQWSLATPDWPPQDGPAMHSVGGRDARWYADHALPVMAYSSSATGYFARRAGAEKAFGHGENPGRREWAEEVAATLACTPTQIALAWLLHQPAQVIPLTGTGSIEHLEEAAGATQVKLTAEQVRWLADG